ncbi:FAD-binding protein [Edwardsiella tarda]|uniref:FAD-binding protein n=1 Tax=Edwardsiella tarda TaxID=636 RepID=UPI00098F22BE|nr:FAD-binding protein [Edwardsiella tarda]WKS81930.1 FAD-binding protein [Edwardsiella tarda]
MSKYATVWVFSDNQSRLAEVIGGARALGENVQAVVQGEAQAAQAFRLGADAVHDLGSLPAERIVESYADTLAHAIRNHGDRALVLLPATRRGKALAARLGARLQAGVVNDASDVALDDGQPVATHMVYGGLALGKERIDTPYAVITLASGAFAAAEEDATRSGSASALAFVAPAKEIACVSRRAKQGESVDLGKARWVVSVGRGIGSQQNIALAQAFSDTIGAELGCSRPVAENEKWMERERYVGISGIMIKPELYLALGISGQIQHMVGANGAQTIMAINKDKNAPIFQYADYGIVGDLTKIVPALTEALKR